MAIDVAPTLVAEAVSGSGGGSGDEIRRKLVLALLQQGTSGEPVQHWLQGADRVGKALLANWQLRDLDAADRAHMAREERYAMRGYPPAGGPGTAPGGGRAPLEPAPRSFGGEQDVVPAPSSEPPFRPVAPLTNLTPQPDMETALQVQRQAMADTPEGLARREQPLQRPDLVAALGQMREGLGAGQRGAFGANAILPTPPPDPAMALAAPQQPAGAMPPQVAAPPPPPAPRAAQVAQAQESAPMSPEERLEAFRLARNPRTSAPLRAQIMQDLYPTLKTETLRDGTVLGITKSGAVRVLYKSNLPPMALPEGSRLIDPNTGQQIVGTQKDEKPVSLPQGSRLVDPKTGREVVGAQREMAPDQRTAIKETDDIVSSSANALGAVKALQALNSKAFEGTGAEARAWIARNSPANLPGFDKQGGIATTQMKVLGMEQALSNLKAIFGGQPAVKESEMLLEMQGSIHKSAAERAAIWERAQRMAEDKIKEHQERARAMRTGEYWKPGYNPGGGWNVMDNGDRIRVRQ